MAKLLIGNAMVTQRRDRWKTPPQHNNCYKWVCATKVWLRYFSRFIKENQTPINLLIIIIGVLWCFKKKELAYSFLTGLVTFVLFEGYTYTVKLHKWLHFLRTIFEDIITYGQVLTTMCNIQNFPVKNCNLEVKHFGIDLRSSRNFEGIHYGQEIEILDREVNVMKEYQNIIKETAKTLIVSVAYKEKIVAFSNAIIRILPRLESAMTIAINTNPSADDLILSIKEVINYSRNIEPYTYDNGWAYTQKDIVIDMDNLTKAYIKCLNELKKELVSLEDIYRLLYYLNS